MEETGDWAEALIECEAAIETLEVSLGVAFNLRGILLEELERPGEALASYDAAMRLDPDLDEAKTNHFELQAALGQGRELATVAACRFAAEAHVLRSRLEAAGIWAIVVDEAVVGANWLYSNLVDGVKVKVREGDVEHALRLLETPEFDERLDEEQEPVGGEGAAVAEPFCPRCGSSDVQQQRFDARRVFASQLLLGVPLPFLKQGWRCRACGHEWRVGHTVQEAPAADDEVPTDADLAARYHELGDMLADRGQWDDAIDAYERSIALEPEDSDRHNSLGVALEEAGRLADAERAYRQAIATDPADSLAYFNLGALCETQARTDEALAAYQECLRRSSDPQERDEVEAILRQLEA